MLDTQDPEDRLIRALLIGGAVAAVSAFLFLALIITILISANFNILNWME